MLIPNWDFSRVLEYGSETIEYILLYSCSSSVLVHKNHGTPLLRMKGIQVRTSPCMGTGYRPGIPVDVPYRLYIRDDFGTAGAEKKSDSGVRINLYVAPRESVRLLFCSGM